MKLNNKKPTKFLNYKLFELVKARPTITNGPTATIKNKDNNCKNVSIMFIKFLILYV